MKAVLIGNGNVGREVQKVLTENGTPVDCIVESDGLYRDSKRIGKSEEFVKYVDAETVVFIAVPSIGDGREMLHYYTESLERGAKVVTCEKAVLANHCDIARKYSGHIGYSATVGGDSGILPAIAEYDGEIRDLKAVVNGTLNYMTQALAGGMSREEVFRDVVAKGFTEPGARDFDEAVANELKDVAYKAAILANHSGMLGQIVTPGDVPVVQYAEGRYAAVIIRDGGIHAGFLPLSATSWLPSGVNNVLYINGEKIAEGPGAGCRVTAERMWKDSRALI